MTATVVVSVHDVAPASARASRRWADLLAHLPLPLTHLVIPGPWRGAELGRDDAGLAGWLRERQAMGDEVSLHGWSHRADVPGPPVRRFVGSLVARGAAEFWTLDRAEAAARAARGLARLDDVGLAVTGTTPPGWLASRAAVRGLADCGLGYTTDHAGLQELGTGRRWNAPALCNRPAAPAARRAFGESAGLAVLGQAWRLVAAGRSVRIGLHPDDLLRPRLAEATVRAVERCLDAGGVPTTYRSVAGRLTEEASHPGRADA